MLFSFNKELLTFSFILPVRCLHNVYDRWLRVYTQADATYLMFSCQKEKQNIYTCIYIHYDSSHWFIIDAWVLCSFSFATIYYRIFYYVVVSYKKKKEIYIYIYIICSQYDCDIDDKTIFNDQSQRVRKKKIYICSMLYW